MKYHILCILFLLLASFLANAEQNGPLSHSRGLGPKRFTAPAVPAPATSVAPSPPSPAERRHAKVRFPQSYVQRFDSAGKPLAVTIPQTDLIFSTNLNNCALKDCGRIRVQIWILPPVWIAGICYYECRQKLLDSNGLVLRIFKHEFSNSTIINKLSEQIDKKDGRFFIIRDERVRNDLKAAARKAVGPLTNIRFKDTFTFYYDNGILTLSAKSANYGEFTEKLNNVPRVVMTQIRTVFNEFYEQVSV